MLQSLKNIFQKTQNTTGADNIDELTILCGLMIEAIYSDSEDGMEKWVEMNRKYSEIWPVITEKKTPPKDAKNWENKENKFELYFDEKPGK